MLTLGLVAAGMTVVYIYFCMSFIHFIYNHTYTFIIILKCIHIRILILVFVLMLAYTYTYTCICTHARIEACLSWDGRGEGGGTC